MREPLDAYLASRCRRVDLALDRFLPKAFVRPRTLHKAMRYSLFAGGKRLRPVLCLAAAEACGGREADAMPLACAVECIHTYSLIHDDLPCMDDDDFRRGRPTSHKVFGEGIAVLAGDALLTIAFELVARAKPTKRWPSAAYLRELATASGSLFLVGGQVADLEGEGRPTSPAQLRWIHERKTSALLAAAICLGAMSANATPDTLRDLGRFGTNLGLAFQVIDDILDATKTSAELGKTAGKDAKAGKATYPSILGMKRAEAEARRFTAGAVGALRLLGRRAARLHALADHLLNRQK
ncbi:MAG: polyprenyl synthetase family protein [Verrucomicrobiae bacterium]|nr:polyprenyl synthetase family protein [Verrucomicrobiae bacterium]